MQAPLDRDFGTITLGWNIENGGGDGDARSDRGASSVTAPVIDHNSLDHIPQVRYPGSQQLICHRKQQLSLSK